MPGDTPKEQMQRLVRTRASADVALIERMGITPAQFERVALNAMMVNPDIAECLHWSIDRALVQCIQSGLMPDNREAALVPFNDRGAGGKVATLIPMVEGRIKIATNATKGLTIRGNVVYRDDVWEYREGLTPVLNHVRNMDVPQQDQNIIAAYAVAHAPGWAVPYFDVMSRAELDRRRAMSRGRNSPWDSWFDEMCIKTVISHLTKRLPKSAGEFAELPDELDHIATEGIYGSFTASAPALPAGNGFNAEASKCQPIRRNAHVKRNRNPTCRTCRRTICRNRRPSNETGEPSELF